MVYVHLLPNIFTILPFATGKKAPRLPEYKIMYRYVIIHLRLRHKENK